MEAFIGAVLLYLFIVWVAYKITKVPGTSLVAGLIISILFHLFAENNTPLILGDLAGLAISYVYFRKPRQINIDTTPKQKPVKAIVFGLILVIGFIWVMALAFDEVDSTASSLPTLTSNGIFTGINDMRAGSNMEIASISYKMQEIAQGFAEDMNKNGCDSLNLKDKRDNGTIKSSWGYIVDCSHTTNTDLVKSLKDSPSMKQILLNKDLEYLGVGASGKSVVVLLSSNPSEEQ